MDPLTAIFVAMGILGSIQKARAQSQAAGANAAILDQNGQLADAAAGQAIARGQQQESRIRIAGGQNRDAQIAARVASGTDPSAGSALDVLQASGGMNELDALTARNNAALEAFGYRTRADQFRYQAETTRQQGQNDAVSSILGGVVGAARMAMPMLQVGSSSTLDPYLGDGKGHG